MALSFSHFSTVSLPVSLILMDGSPAPSAGPGTTLSVLQMSSSVYSRPGWNSTKRATKLSRPRFMLTLPGRRQLRTALVAPGSV